MVTFILESQCMLLKSMIVERTDRQTKFLQNNIDLIKIFNIILKKVKNLPVSNVMWHFVNGVCYFDRGKVCQRCKGEPSLTYLFCLSCNQTTNFYLPSSIISYYLEWKRNSSSSPKSYSCSLSRNYHHVYVCHIHEKRIWTNC